MLFLYFYIFMQFVVILLRRYMYKKERDGMFYYRVYSLHACGAWGLWVVSIVNSTQKYRIFTFVTK